MADNDSARDFDRKVAELLSVEELADLGALYELGMLRGFGERYQDILSESLVRYQSGRGWWNGFRT